MRKYNWRQREIRCVIISSNHFRCHKSWRQNARLSLKCLEWHGLFINACFYGPGNESFVSFIQNATHRRHAEPEEWSPIFSSILQSTAEPRLWYSAWKCAVSRYCVKRIASCDKEVSVPFLYYHLWPISRIILDKKALSWRLQFLLLFPQFVISSSISPNTFLTAITPKRPHPVSEAMSRIRT